MELMNANIGTPRSRWNRMGRKQLIRADYHSELRKWLLRAILEAEKEQDFGKKDQLLCLLKDL